MKQLILVCAFLISLGASGAHAQSGDLTTKLEIPTGVAELLTNRSYLRELAKVGREADVAVTGAGIRRSGHAGPTAFDHEAYVVLSDSETGAFYGEIVAGMARLPSGAKPYDPMFTNVRFVPAGN